MATRLPWRRVHPQDRYPPARREFTISRSSTSSSSRSRRRALTHRISSAAAGGSGGGPDVDEVRITLVIPSSDRRLGSWPKYVRRHGLEYKRLPTKVAVDPCGGDLRKRRLRQSSIRITQAQTQGGPALVSRSGPPPTCVKPRSWPSPTRPGLAISRVRISNASSSAAYGQKRCTGSASHLELSALLRHQHCHNSFPVHPKL